MVTNINFLLTISIDCQVQHLWELIKWSQREKSLIFYQFLPTNSVRKCIEISLENLFVDIGLKGLNFFIIRHHLILQASRRELIQMDFEAILKYFRISMPKKYLDEEEYKKLVNSALGFRVCADDVIFINPTMVF